MRISYENWESIIWKLWVIFIEKFRRCLRSLEKIEKFQRINFNEFFSRISQLTHVFIMKIGWLDFPETNSKLRSLTPEPENFHRCNKKPHLYSAQKSFHLMMLITLIKQISNYKTWVNLSFKKSFSFFLVFFCVIWSNFKNLFFFT